MVKRQLEPGRGAEIDGNAPVKPLTSSLPTSTYKGQVYRIRLLRSSYREGGKVTNETLGNLSHLPDAQARPSFRLLRAFEITRSRRAPRQLPAVIRQRLASEAKAAQAWDLRLPNDP